MGPDALCPALRSLLGAAISINLSKDLLGSCRAAGVCIALQGREKARAGEGRQRRMGAGAARPPSLPAALSESLAEQRKGGAGGAGWRVRTPSGRLDHRA